YTIPVSAAKADEPETTPEPTPADKTENSGTSETSSNTESTSAATTQAPAQPKDNTESKSNAIWWILGGVCGAGLIAAAVVLLKKRGAK
ncbi:MAG: hypothetical protein J5728_03370, partial [Lachnospiraceae bacterium]|nr:hypothetical protein [Lachnospiraceae bacterium]